MPNQPAKADDPFKGMKTGGWTKYGGPSLGMRKEKIVGRWCCQACGEEVPAELKPFLFKIYKNEFLRLCNNCMSLATQQQGISIIRFEKVLEIVRTKRD